VRNPIVNGGGNLEGNRGRELTSSSKRTCGDIQIAGICSPLLVAVPPIASGYRNYQKFLNSSKRTHSGADCGHFFVGITKSS